MHLISIHNLSEKDVLGRSIYTENRELLLAAGYKMTRSMIRKLKDRGYNYVYVLDGVADDIVPEEVITRTLRQAVSITIEDAYANIRANKYLRSLDPEVMKERLEEDPKLKSLIELSPFRKQAVDLLEEILGNNVKLFSSLPVRPGNAEIFQHAVDTALICILMGLSLEFKWDDIRSLSTGALLHDIGKTVLGLNVSDESSEREREIMIREHPTYSMLIVKGSDPATFREQLTVHQHHEQLDGKGYPIGLRSDDVSLAKHQDRKKSNIFRHALILGVANRYDNLVSGAFDGQLHTPEQALLKIVGEAGVVWNSSAVKALAKVVQLFPVGTRIRILKARNQEFQGSYGVVVQVNPDDPSKPIIIITHNSMQQKTFPKQFNCAADKSVKLELVV